MPTQTEVSLSERLCTKAPIATFDAGEDITITWQSVDAPNIKWHSRRMRIVTDGTASICGSELTPKGPTRNFCSAVTGSTYALLVRETVVHDGKVTTRYEVLQVYVSNGCTNYSEVKDYIKAWHG